MVVVVVAVIVGREVTQKLRAGERVYRKTGTKEAIWYCSTVVARPATSSGKKDWEMLEQTRKKLPVVS